MKNPPHPGDLIRTEVIEPLGLTVSKAATRLRRREDASSRPAHPYQSVCPGLMRRPPTRAYVSRPSKLPGRPLLPALLARSCLHRWRQFIPSTGKFPFPAFARMRRVSARFARPPLSRKYASVRKAETFSATATLMSWFSATLPSPRPSATPPSTRAASVAQNCFVSWSSPNPPKRRARLNNVAIKASRRHPKIALVKCHDGVGSAIHGRFQNHVIVRIR